MERIVADAILEKAEEMRVERERAFFKNLSNAVQAGVARAFGAKRGG